MAEESGLTHTKPDGSVANFMETSAPQLILTTADGSGQHSLQNLMIRGKPLEDLASVASTMASLNQPLVLVSQEHNVEADYSQNQSEALTSTRGVLTRDHSATAQQMGETQLPLSEGGSRTADATNVNNISSALQSTSASATPDYSSFYHQQIMINAQLFLQQQQTVNALIGKVDGLTRLVENREEQTASADENTRIKQLSRKAVISQKTHVMSDSDLQDVSSASEDGESESEDENDDKSDSEDAPSLLQKNKEKPEVSENMKMLMELGKKLEKTEAVGKKVDDTLSKVVDSGIRSMIDRNLAKELCGNYDRPENCKALVVPKINRELWNTTSLAKVTKEKDKLLQTAQKYLNQGLIPLVQLTEKLLNGDQSNFKLARDSLQLLAYAHRDISNIRRQQLKAVVADKYKPLCHDSTPLTENLLGDDLEKQIKTMDEMRKVGKDLTKNRPEKRKRKYQDSYNKPSKYTKYNYSGYNNNHSGYNKEKNSFLEKKSRFHHKPGQHKRKNQKQWRNMIK